LRKGRTIPSGGQYGLQCLEVWKRKNGKREKLLPFPKKEGRERCVPLAQRKGNEKKKGSYAYEEKGKLGLIGQGLVEGRLREGQKPSQRRGTDCFSRKEKGDILKSKPSVKGKKKEKNESTPLPCLWGRCLGGTSVWRRRGDQLSLNNKRKRDLSQHQREKLERQVSKSWSGQGRRKGGT